MKTTRINGQKFAKISYTNNGNHAPTVTLYPVENLRWLAQRCGFKFVK